MPNCIFNIFIRTGNYNKDIELFFFFFGFVLFLFPGFCGLLIAKFDLIKKKA